MAQKKDRWRRFLALSGLLVGIGMMALSYSFHQYPSWWEGSYLTTAIPAPAQTISYSFKQAWAPGLFAMGSILLLGQCALFLWGRKWSSGSWILIYILVLASSVISGSYLTQYLLEHATG